MGRFALFQKDISGKWKSVPLGPEEALLGRGTEADIRLADTQASRRHATVRREGKGILLQDQGSANGTFVLGERVKQRLLLPGDSFSIGQSLFYVIQEGEYLPPEAAIGVWVIKELLKLEGTAWRYRAQQKVLEREVELEVLRQSLTSDKDLLRLYKTLLRRVAADNDPAIVPVFDQAEEKGRALVARRLATLRALSWDELNLQERAARLGELLAFLSRWSERGLPVPLALDRVTTGPDGKLCLRFPSAEDLFLVSKRLHARLPRYLPYAAPEELAQRHPTGKEESYRLGVLLYRGLTGKFPREGNNRREIVQAFKKPMVPPRRLIPQIPAKAAELVEQLLEKAPEKRPAVMKATEAWPGFHFPRHVVPPVRKQRPQKTARRKGPQRPVRKARKAPQRRGSRPASPKPAVSSPFVKAAKYMLFWVIQGGVFFASSEIVYWIMNNLR